MKPTWLLRLILLCYLVGLWIGKIIDPSIALALVGIMALTLLYIPKWWLMGLLSFSVGMFYYGAYERVIYPDYTHSLVGKTLQLKVVVKGEPRIRAKHQSLRLELLAWKSSNSAWQTVPGQLLWQRAPLPQFSAGDELVLEGTVVNVMNFSEDFNARTYWSRWGISQELIRTKIVTRPPSKLTTNLQVRHWAEDRMAHHLAKPHRTVALGMLVGLKEKLPKALEANFKEAGLQHLLVVSGTNVTLLVILLSWIFKPLGPWPRYVLLALGIGFYVYIVGFDPPALRASLLGVITGLALTSGYFCEYRNLLLLVAVILSIFDPYFVTHDISFWLSFSATAGMMLGVPWLYQKLKFLKYKYLRLLLAASITAQISVFPLLIVQFGSFPYAGLFTNLLTEPLVPLIMLLGSGAVALGDWSLLGLGYLWGLALWFSIQSLIYLAQVASLLPIVVLPVWLGYSWGVLLLSFGVYAGFSSYYQQRYWQKFEAELSS